MTGVASGIGKATALRFAKLGATLVLNDINDDGLQQTANECKDLSGVQVVRASPR